MPEGTISERSERVSIQKIESVGEMEDGSLVPIKIVYSNENIRGYRNGRRIEPSD
ncbi:MAG: hypothetical protein RL430_1789 [Actinomycetota bacterium]